MNWNTFTYTWTRENVNASGNNERKHEKMRKWKKIEIKNTNAVNAVHVSILSYMTAGKICVGLHLLLHKCSSRTKIVEIEKKM